MTKHPANRQERRKLSKKHSLDHKPDAANLRKQGLAEARKKDIDDVFEDWKDSTN